MGSGVRLAPRAARKQRIQSINFTVRSSRAGVCSSLLFFISRSNQKMKPFLPLFVFLLLVAFVGCGDSNPPTYKVTGVVTLEGKPVEGATVTFTPSGGSEQKPAVGTSGADGKYSLTTFTGGDGALPGSYKVTVSKIQYAPGENPYAPKEVSPAPERDPSKPMTQDERDQMLKDAYKGTPKPGSVKPGTSKNELPDRYNQDGLSYVVTKQAGQVFDLKLSSKN